MRVQVASKKKQSKTNMVSAGPVILFFVFSIDINQPLLNILLFTLLLFHKTWGFYFRTYQHVRLYKFFLRLLLPLSLSCIWCQDLKGKTASAAVEKDRQQKTNPTEKKAKLSSGASNPAKKWWEKYNVNGSAGWMQCNIAHLHVPSNTPRKLGPLGILLNFCTTNLLCMCRWKQTRRHTT